MNNTRKVNIYMHGVLADVCGKEEWQLAVVSPSEALTAIDVNTDGRLFKYLREHGEDKFQILIDKDQVDSVEMLAANSNYIPKEIHFMPVLQGADSDGTLYTIIGAVLIVVAVILTYGAASAAAAAGTGTTAASGASAGVVVAATAGKLAFTLGVSLALGGISQLLAPNDDKGEKPGHVPSYLFNGPVNTTRQGNAVPYACGWLEAGSQIISGSIKNRDIAI